LTSRTDIADAKTELLEVLYEKVLLKTMATLTIADIQNNGWVIYRSGQA